MNIKSGASIALLQPAMRLALEQVEQCYAAFGVECIVTSGDERETVHKGKPVAGDAEDPHYVGKALDFRIWNVPEESRAALVKKIRETLGDHYVVLWEAPDPAHQHLHVQAGRIVV